MIQTQRLIPDAGRVVRFQAVTQRLGLVRRISQEGGDHLARAFCVTRESLQHAVPVEDIRYGVSIGRGGAQMRARRQPARQHLGQRLR